MLVRSGLLQAASPAAGSLTWGSISGPSTRRLRLTAAAAAPEGSTAAPLPAGGSGGSSSEAPAAAVQIEYRGRHLKAERGATLRTVLLLSGESPHNGRAMLINCRGLGTCGTCAVEIQGAIEPLEWTAQERLRLNFPPHSPPGNRRLRLACQVACQGDLRVIKREGFWGQAAQQLPDLPLADAPDGRPGSGTAAAAAVAPLGELEFILDRRRKSGQP